MAKKIQMGHETEDITLTLHKYGTIHDLIADTQVPPELDPFVRKAKWVGSAEELGVPRKLSLSDYRIDADRSFTLSLGANTWVRTTIYSRFGIPTILWVNDTVLRSEDTPWTVWIHDPRPDEKYGKYAKFCGLFFRTEEEAQKWVDENVEQENDDDSSPDGEE